MSSRKVESCATCAYSVKVVQGGWLWQCLASDNGDHIPCARGKLPRVPEFCPRRKG